MKRTLQEHIDWLKTRQTNLNAEFMGVPTPEAANYIESELRTIRMAIAHYEAALELELSLRGEQPLNGARERTLPEK